MKLDKLKADVVDMRCDTAFDNFWSDVSEVAHLLKVKEHEFVTKIKTPSMSG